MKNCFAVVMTTRGQNAVVRLGDTEESLQGELMPDAIKNGEVLRRIRVWPCELHEAPDTGVVTGFSDNFINGVVVRKPTLRIRSDEERLERSRIRRAAEYPSVGDQLDDIWKALERLTADGVTLPAETSDRLRQIKEVKSRNPKN